jgi:hypothetical protein
MTWVGQVHGTLLVRNEKYHGQCNHSIAARDLTGRAHRSIRAILDEGRRIDAAICPRTAMGKREMFR